MAVVVADSLFIEPNHPRVIRKEIFLRRWPSRLEGFTIALLSDFHYDPYFSVHPIRSAVDIINGLQPDLIALTGDFVSAPWFGDIAKGAAVAEPCAQLLGKLQAPCGLWAVLGNHDAYTDPDRVTETLRAVGIPVLSNRSVPVEKDGARFWLGGVDDVLEGTADLDAALHDARSEEAFVLMAHEPDYADYVACQERVGSAWQNGEHWARMSILNTARSGKFSSDRAVREYCDDIWNVKPLRITLDPSMS